MGIIFSYHNESQTYIIDTNLIIMNHVVSITSQGQLTIPKALRQAFGICGRSKAAVSKKARQAFSRQWGQRGRNS